MSWALEQVISSRGRGNWTCLTHVQRTASPPFADSPPSPLPVASLSPLILHRGSHWWLKYALHCHIAASNSSSSRGNIAFQFSLPLSLAFSIPFQVPPPWNGTVQNRRHAMRQDLFNDRAQLLPCPSLPLSTPSLLCNLSMAAGFNTLSAN